MDVKFLDLKIHGQFKSVLAKQSSCTAYFKFLYHFKPLEAPLLQVAVIIIYVESVKVFDLPPTSTNLIQDFTSYFFHLNINLFDL